MLAVLDEGRFFTKDFQVVHLQLRGLSSFLSTRFLLAEDGPKSRVGEKSYKRGNP